jgi:hypothetical protein
MKKVSGLSFDQAERKAIELAAERGKPYYVIGKADAFEFTVASRAVKDMTQLRVTPEQACERMTLLSTQGDFKPKKQEKIRGILI